MPVMRKVYPPIFIVMSDGEERRSNRTFGQYAMKADGETESTGISSRSPWLRSRKPLPGVADTMEFEKSE